MEFSSLFFIIVVKFIHGYLALFVALINFFLLSYLEWVIVCVRVLFCVYLPFVFSFISSFREFRYPVV